MHEDNLESMTPEFLQPQSLLPQLRLSIAIGFILLTAIFLCFYSYSIHLDSTQLWIISFSAAAGSYMAMNIGANDVANNMGPLVGSNTLSLFSAVVLAAICEVAGALLAGPDVVNTIKGGIIDSTQIVSVDNFVMVMLAALIAAALWLNIATWLRAPVSTTHSIIGAVLGSSIMCGGPQIVNWYTMSGIFGSWIISPILGAIIAALILYFIKHKITYQENLTLAASKVVPGLIAFMAWAFSLYMLQKGLAGIIHLNSFTAFILSCSIALAIYLTVVTPIKRKASQLASTKDAVNTLFTWPLIFAAGLLSFSHGANDVANAIGPLAAIYESVVTHSMVLKSTTPFAILLVGALGIALGLFLYGGGLIHSVGRGITELDRMRAYAIAMSTSLTVIVATHLGMPISTTHVAIGSIFGIGVLREYLKSRHKKDCSLIIAMNQQIPGADIAQALDAFKAAPLDKKIIMVKQAQSLNLNMEKNRSQTEPLVARSEFLKIIAAWSITLPITAILSAALFALLSLQ